MQKCSKVLLLASLFTLLNAQSIDADLEGFDDAPSTSTPSVNTEAKDEIMDGFDDEPSSTESSTEVVAQETMPNALSGFTGKLTEQVAFSWDNDAPYEDVTSLKSSLFLDYEHKFDNGIRIKINAKAYYDAIYSLKDRGDFASDTLNELESELELFDAYIEGKITDNFDYKIGRQVVVWGRSDTIRVTDILNPLDNRNPAMTDIEDLRLPVTMVKLDYFVGDWRITPIAIVEQRFSKNPPFGGDFNPSPIAIPSDESYDDVTYALSVGAEFSGWDINFYAANTHDDAGYIDKSSGIAQIKHDKVTMFGTALNILSGSWLFKTELAYFDGLKYTATAEKTFSRTDALLGVEYNGFSDTLISYDIVSRQINNYDKRLLEEFNPLQKHYYQHAFRVSSDFLNATLTANYLLSLYGEKLDEGGFQRAWVKYELADAVNMNVGIVDYIGGNILFDAIENNDMVFMDISYSF